MPGINRGGGPAGSSVGPYWFVRDSSGTIRLIAHRCALAHAEEYGDFLTCPHGHYDLWESWRAGSPPGGLADIVREAEYEEWPRGRVVLNFVQGRFIVHGDKQVFEHKLQHRVLEHFGIPRGGWNLALRMDITKAHGRCIRNRSVRAE
jgi:hypothetical protein